MEVQRTVSTGWLSNAYLVDDGDGSGILIDGNGVPGPLLATIQGRGLTVAAVLLTHHHVDHVDVKAYRDLGAPVLAHPLTAQELDGTVVDQTLGAGERIRAGALDIQCLHTPGHAHGHLAFFVNQSVLFTGDVLFADTVGGTRAPQATGLADLRRSLRQITDLPPPTQVYPGHCQATTIGHELEHNVFLRALLGNDVPPGEPCTVGGEQATLLLWGPDYDGTNKAWIVLDDGTEHITGGSQVSRPH